MENAPGRNIAKYVLTVQLRNERTAVDETAAHGVAVTMAVDNHRVRRHNRLSEAVHG